MKLSRLLFIILIFSFTVSIFAQSETEKGIELYRNGDYDQAITVLENAVKIDEKDRQAWLYLGMSFGRKGKDKDALKALRKWDSISVKSSNKILDNDSIENLKILSKPRVTSTELSRKNQTEGRVRLIVEFMKDEKIGLVFALQSLPDGLAENCIEAARQIKFKPAQKDGKPISTIKIIEYTFSLY